MTFDPKDPTTWPIRIPIIAHDVGRSNDRSTAVVGGHCIPLLGPRVLGVQRFVELPLGLYGSQLANALAQIDQDNNRNCLIIADLSNDATYAETLFETFSWRVIGVQIGRSGEGMTCERRLVRGGSIPIYNVGRTYLLDLLHAEFQNDQIRLPLNAESKRAYAQLVALELEQRESGIVYKCPPGQHDDLAISLAMLAWAARHPHVQCWMRPINNAHPRRRPRIDAAAAWRGCT
jgi:hypothetical protein